MATPRRFQRFSLRAVMILITVLCILLAYPIPRARRQKEVADWVRSFGRTPYYSYQLDPRGNYAQDLAPWGPTWLRQLIGIDFFYSIRMVHLDDKKLKDIALLARLDSLSHVELESCDLTTIEPLKELTRLEVVSINKNAIADLTPIENSRSLHLLSASSTDVSDLSPLRRLPNLKSLYLRRSKVDDLTALDNHPSLQTLDISQTMVKDLRPLRSVATLVNLDISGTSVTDADVTALQEALPKLIITR